MSQARAWTKLGLHFPCRQVNHLMALHSSCSTKPDSYCACHRGLTAHSELDLRLVLLTFTSTMLGQRVAQSRQHSEILQYLSLHTLLVFWQCSQISQWAGCCVKLHDQAVKCEPKIPWASSQDTNVRPPDPSGPPPALCARPRGCPRADQTCYQHASPGQCRARGRRRGPGGRPGSG